MFNEYNRNALDISVYENWQLYPTKVKPPYLN